jgi:hypothetical protein
VIGHDGYLHSPEAQKVSVLEGIMKDQMHVSSSCMLGLGQTPACKKYRERSVTCHGPLNGFISLSTFPCFESDQLAGQAKIMLPSEYMRGSRCQEQKVCNASITAPEQVVWHGTACFKAFNKGARI